MSRSNLSTGMMTDVPTLNIPLMLHAILEEYVLPWDGDHGIAHWARVLENGLRLVEETGANIEVVWLFAILHDFERVNEGGDPKHAPVPLLSPRLISQREPTHNWGWSSLLMGILGALRSPERHIASTPLMVAPRLRGRIAPHGPRAS